MFVSTIGFKSFAKIQARMQLMREYRQYQAVINFLMTAFVRVRAAKMSPYLLCPVMEEINMFLFNDPPFPISNEFPLCLEKSQNYFSSINFFKGRRLRFLMENSKKISAQAPKSPLMAMISNFCNQKPYWTPQLWWKLLWSRS